MSDRSENDQGQPAPRSSQTRWRARLKRLLKLWEAQAALGWAIIVILGALVGTIYLVQASSVAQLGRRMQILQNDLADLKRGNAEIERKIAESQSLDQLQIRAQQLGFLPANPDEIDYLVVPDYPADEPEITLESLRPVEAVPPPEPIETMEQAIMMWIQQRFSGLSQGVANQQ